MNIANMKTNSLSSYQKMKQKYEKERQELINDIIILVKKEGTVEALTVKRKWNVELDKELFLMFG